MKVSFNKISMLAASAVIAGAALSGCVADQPFSDAEGEGVLRMSMVINSDLTRAEISDDSQEALRSNCVVYISEKDRGLIHKYKGLQNVPDEIRLKSGSYIAEAWTGDSVSASFDKKFFRGYVPFQIQRGLNQVAVVCKIANVVASINHETIDPALVSDLKVKVANTRGSLEFNSDNYDFAKGYFMQPNGDNKLTYTVTGTNAEGKAFTHEGVIENVERAHEYILNFSYNPDYEEMGGSFIKVTVDDTEVVVEDEVEILAAPDVLLVDGDIDKQVVGNAGAFTDKIVRVAAFGSISSLEVSSPQAEAIHLPVGEGGVFDLMDLTQSAEEHVRASGIDWSLVQKEGSDIQTALVVLKAEFLNRIPEANEEYVINFKARDSYGKVTEKALRLAVGEGAIVIEDPVVVDPVPDKSVDQLAVLSTKATLTGSIASADAINPGIRFREAGTGADWQFVAAPTGARNKAMRLRKGAPGAGFSITITGLKPGTRYEYQSVAEGFESESLFFTTESTFTIPNASMEEWSTFNLKSGDAMIPNANNERSFWDSGNHGSIMMSINLTQSSSDMSHSGSLSARLRSQFVGLGVFAGKFAAGNLFAGTYLETQGTDGRLEFGRQYDGSHPSALRFYANYRPAKVVSGNNKGSGDKLAVGDTDQAQIYVALSTAPVEVRTKSSNRKLFNPDDPEIVAYGQVTWTSDFGPDGQLQQVDIPLEYYSKAKTTKPLYLIIVCSASKFGDFFQGGEGSVMYVDDFELVYE